MDRASLLNEAYGVWGPTGAPAEALAALLVELAHKDEAIALLRDALEPFVRLSDARDEKYSKRGGDVNRFPDAHPSYDVRAEDVRLGVWRKARAALAAIRAAKRPQSCRAKQIGPDQWTCDCDTPLGCDLPEPTKASRQPTDLLDIAYINSLPQPLLGRLLGGAEWEVYDIDAQTGLVRINVVGKLEIKHVSDFTSFRDCDGRAHQVGAFYSDATPEDREVHQQQPIAWRWRYKHLGPDAPWTLADYEPDVPNIEVQPLCAIEA